MTPPGEPDGPRACAARITCPRAPSAPLFRAGGCVELFCPPPGPGLPGTGEQGRVLHGDALWPVLRRAGARGMAQRLPAERRRSGHHPPRCDALEDPGDRAAVRERVPASLAIRGPVLDRRGGLAGAVAVRQLAGALGTDQRLLASLSARAASFAPG